jgi:hypothetical protein
MAVVIGLICYFLVSYFRRSNLAKHNEVWK